MLNRPKTTCPTIRLIWISELLRFHPALEKSHDEVENPQDDRHINNDVPGVGIST